MNSLQRMRESWSVRALIAATFFLANAALTPDLLAFENKKTHRTLAIAAAPAWRLNPRVAAFGFPSTPDFPWLNGVRWTATEILEEAAYREDVPVCRAMNHFHRVDQGVSATNSGLTDLKVGARIICAAIDPANDDLFNPATLWASAGPNEYSWGIARSRLAGAVLLPTAHRREVAMAASLRSLGQVMHLLQDMAQPAHARNDAHPLEAIFPRLSWGKKLEAWCAGSGRVDCESFIISAGLSLPTGPPLPGPDGSFLRFFDADLSGPGGDGWDQGLAEFAGKNFQSPDTIFTTLEPSAFREFDSRQSVEPLISRTDLEQVRANVATARFSSCDSTSDQGQYVSRTTDPRVDHFLRLGCLSKYYASDQERFARSLHQDACVFHDYAELLLPRAVSYSAALIDYFFRGGVSADWNPIGNGNFRVTVTNLSAERLKGNVTLALRVPPGTHGLSGDEDILTVSGSRSVDLGPFGEADDRAEVEVLAQDIPGLDGLTESALSFERRVVVEGDLGGEKVTAVVAGIAPALTTRLLARIHRLIDPSTTVWTWESIDVETGHSEWTRAAAPSDVPVQHPSPDGRTLVWVSSSSPPQLKFHDLVENDHSKDRELALVLPAGVSSLSISPGVSGAFSPDGRRLLTLANVGGLSLLRLVEVELSSGRVKIHPQEIDQGQEVSWSSGGDFAQAESGRASLRSGSLDEIPQRPSGYRDDFNGSAFAISPDGTTSYRTLIQSDWPYFQHIFLHSWEGGGWNDLGEVATWPTSNANCHYFPNEAMALSPDGRFLAHLRGYPTGGADLVVRNLATNKERILIVGPRDCQLYVGQIDVDQIVWAAETALGTPPAPVAPPARILLAGPSRPRSAER